MHQIEGTDKATSILEWWTPNDLAYIEQLAFRADGKGVSRLTIVGLFQRRGQGSWPDIDKALHRVELAFDGVSRLHLSDFGGGCVQIMGFDIRSVAHRGWDNVLFEVEDYEDGRLRFVCARAQVLRVDKEEVFL